MVWVQKILPHRPKIKKKFQRLDDARIRAHEVLNAVMGRLEKFTNTEEFAARYKSTKPELWVNELQLFFLDPKKVDKCFCLHEE
jgi:hypothetical protein